MNDLSGAVADRQRCCWRVSPVPRAVLCVAVPSLLLGLAVSAFILAVVHNAVLLLLVLSLSALVVSFFAWNARAALNDWAVLLFLDRLPWSDLPTAKDGDLVKLSGRVSCGSIALESSYEKAPRCVYTSTLLYEYAGCGLQELWSGFFRWRLTYSERFTADFHLTDIRSGIRVTVKAGHDSKVTFLIKESTLINTTSKNRSLSSTLVRWLRDRQLSAEPRALRLEEGYVKEGSHLTVMGMVNRSNGTITIVPLLEPISTGCFFRKFLLPMVLDGLIFKFSDDLGSEDTPHLPS
ncbi:unnamed protein product [Spirodela intermedia]|uniref:Uncharacterized protein n=1 Tax=Spirodela intermedia TaxID=51605 RepID=A0A7I8K4K7_SPIIN|nr:unnamed protein product [Spirodela intermedia]